MNIAVLAGGISLERNVSLASGIAVSKALDLLGHKVITIDPALGTNCIIDYNNYSIPEEPPTVEEIEKYNTKNIIDAINSEIFDEIELAFIVLHGKFGEDGRIQSLLELRGIPYTGSGVKSSAVAIDKITSKFLFLTAGVQVPQWAIIHPDEYENYDLFKTIREELGEKLVIKPTNQGSTIGITVVTDGNLDDIYNGIAIASNYSRRVLIEQYIEGKEITVGILDKQALPVIEIIPESGFYDYLHKYKKGKTEYICPAELDEFSTEFIQNNALSAFRVLGCKVFGRVDFRMDEEGNVYCLEVNTIPGFTETSLVPKAAMQIGIDFQQLCQKIIDVSINNI